MNALVNKESSLTLEAEDLCVQYGNTTALDIPQMQVCGKIIAVIGHNGSGKSTLLKTILELIKPRSGQVGAILSHGSSKTKLIPEDHMAFSQENGGIFGDITVEEYLKLWCRIKHNDANYFRQPHLEFMRELGIAPLLRQLGRQLSKGQRHRVQAAVGFIINPDLFIFDEPFDGLDIGQSIQLARVMQKKSEEMTMILSSHRMEVVERLADQIIVLQDGAVRATGNIRSVCEAISGTTLAVRYTTNPSLSSQMVVHTMRDEFKNSLVQQIGDQVAITGMGVSQDRVRCLLSAMDAKDIDVYPTHPSLVDAMQYHLSTLT